jgi:hypothetical protein
MISSVRAAAGSEALSLASEPLSLDRTATVPPNQDFLMVPSVPTLAQDAEPASIRAASLALTSSTAGQVDPVSFALLQQTTVAPAVPAAPAHLGGTSVISIGRPLLATLAPQPAASPDTRIWVGAERVYLVEGGMVRQYSSGGVPRSAVGTQQKHGKIPQATRSFERLADAVRESSANFAFGGTAAELQRTAMVSSLSVPEPEPASILPLAAVAVGALLKRRRI